MKECPHCSTEINIKELPHQGLFESYRICPNCDGYFTVDKNTKYRQALFIIILVISAAFSIFLYLGDARWLIPAITSYIAIGALMYWGNKKMFYVPYKAPEQNK